MPTFEPLPNKYTRCYFQIVNKRKIEPAIGYSENHHIHPEALGGSNERENKVRLTAREHYICHLLLTKMLKGEAKKKMAFAFVSMRGKTKTADRYIPNSHVYQVIRSKLDVTHDEAAKHKMREAAKHKPPVTEETKQKISEGIKASYTPELIELRRKQFSEQVFSAEHRANMSKAKTGTIRSEESKERQSASLLGGNHFRCKTWTLRSPTGEILVTNDMTSLCKKYGISYSAFRNRARIKSQEPLVKGTGKGWVVISCID